MFVSLARAKGSFQAPGIAGRVDRGPIIPAGLLSAAGGWGWSSNLGTGLRRIQSAGLSDVLMCCQSTEERESSFDCR